MLPDLSRLSQKTRSVDGTLEDAMRGVDCSICFAPLNADSPTYPWNGTGFWLRQACTNDPGHFFHAGCLRSMVQSDRNAPCPECRAPLLNTVRALVPPRGALGPGGFPAPYAPPPPPPSRQASDPRDREPPPVVRRNASRRARPRGDDEGGDRMPRLRRPGDNMEAMERNDENMVYVGNVGDSQIVLVPRPAVPSTPNPIRPQQGYPLDPAPDPRDADPRVQAVIFAVDVVRRDDTDWFGLVNHAVVYFRTLMVVWEAARLAVDTTPMPVDRGPLERLQQSWRAYLQDLYRRDVGQYASQAWTNRLSQLHQLVLNTIAAFGLPPPQMLPWPPPDVDAEDDDPGQRPHYPRRILPGEADEEEEDE